MSPPSDGSAHLDLNADLGEAFGGGGSATTTRMLDTSQRERRLRVPRR